MGILAEGERVVRTTNRKFRRTDGTCRTSEIYLASPAVAAAIVLVQVTISKPSDTGL